MGIYVFSYEKLKKYLTEDNENENSSNDFGKDIIPAMLKNNEIIIDDYIDDILKISIQSLMIIKKDGQRTQHW